MTKYFGQTLFMPIVGGGIPNLSAKKRKKKQQTTAQEPSKNSYNVGEAKTHLSEILERVEENGEEIMLTRRGKPVARVVPDRAKGGIRQLGFARGEVKLPAGWDEPIPFEEFFNE